MTEMRDAINFVGFWCSRPPPLQCPPPLTPQYLTILMTVRGGTIFCRVLAPPPQTPQYLTILMTERGGGGAIIICRILASPNDPPPPDDTILNYLNDRERVAPLCRILTPPPPTSPKYFTILMTEMRDCYFCRILAPPNAPPPSPDAKILNYLNDRERGRHCLL